MKKILFFMLMSVALAACSNSDNEEELVAVNTTETTTPKVKAHSTKDSLLLEKLQTYNNNMPVVPKTRGFWNKLWRAVKTDVYALPSCVLEGNMIESGIAAVATPSTVTIGAFVVSTVKTLIKTGQRSYKAYKGVGDCAGLSAVYVRNEYLYNVSTHCLNGEGTTAFIANMDSLIDNMGVNSFINDSLPVFAGELHNLYLQYAIAPYQSSLSPINMGGASVNGGPSVQPIDAGPVLQPKKKYGVPDTSDEEVESFIARGDTNDLPMFVTDSDYDALQEMAGEGVISEATADVMDLFYEALNNVNNETGVYSLINYYISEVKGSNTLTQQEKNEICMQLEMCRHSYDFWKNHVTI